MAEIKKIHPISLANINGIIMIIVSLCFIILMSILGSAMGSLIGLPIGFGVLGIGMIIIVPIYGAMGWISGAIGALLYNLIAGWIGGIKIDIVN